MMNIEVSLDLEWLLGISFVKNEVPLTKVAKFFNERIQTITKKCIWCFCKYLKTNQNFSN